MDDKSKKELYQLRRDVMMLIAEISKQSDNNVKSAAIFAERAHQEMKWTTIKVGVMMSIATIAATLIAAALN